MLEKLKTPGHYRFHLPNPHNAPIVDFVPDENIGRNLEQLCIRRGNLKYLEGKIVDAI